MLRFSYKWFFSVTFFGEALFNAEGPAFRGKGKRGRRERGEGAALRGMRYAFFLFTTEGAEDTEKSPTNFGSAKFSAIRRSSRLFGKGTITLILFFASHAKIALYVLGTLQLILCRLTFILCM